MRTFVAVAGMALICLLLSSCSGDKTKNETGGVTLSPASSTPSPADTPAQASQVNVCAFFSEADAQSIMGVPMKRSAKTNPQRNCMYEEATARPNSIGPGTIALTLDQHQTTAEEEKAWAEVKEVRHLQASQKNVQALTGIGDEAYFTGNSQKGKVGVAGIIVRKGKSDFMLDSMVLEYMASPTAMKSVAKKVADQLK